MPEQASPMGFFERYLSLWVFLCIIAGTLLGLMVPAAAQSIGALEIAKVNIPVGLLIWAAAIAVAGPAGSWILLGFMSGYVLYDLVHYACHQFPMKGRLGRRLKTHHMRHHHLSAKGNYAITGMLWDRVFSTYLSSNSKV